MGYLVTDQNTPIISAWSRLVHRQLQGLKFEERDLIETAKDLSYWSRFESPFDPLEGDEYVIAVKHTATQLGTSASELAQYDIMIDTMNFIEQLEIIQLQPERKQTIPVVFRGETHDCKKEDHQQKINKILKDEKESLPTNLRPNKNTQQLSSRAPSLKSPPKNQLVNRNENLRPVQTTCCPDPSPPALKSKPFRNDDVKNHRGENRRDVKRGQKFQPTFRQSQVKQQKQKSVEKKVEHQEPSPSQEHASDVL